MTILGMALLPAGCAAGSSRRAPMGSAEPGRMQFQSYCAACHAPEAQEADAAPPLEGSPWVTGEAGRLIKIVLHGVRGPIEVQGKIYDREMPGFGQVLSDTDVAALLSFVRKRFGGLSEPITPAAVSRVRAANAGRVDYWSVQELLAEP
ncbi:MAG: cytochrome c [Acidobacteria bacterium]|nr:cytochrome c [Acidobacteriota bacterium]